MNTLNDLIILRSENQQFGIFDMDFVATWMSMCNYIDANIAETMPAFARLPMPLYSHCKECGNQLIVCSVETICNILNDDAYYAKWKLKDDPAFMFRNRDILLPYENHCVVLNEKIIAKWNASSVSYREEVLEYIDARIFPTMQASACSRN